MRLIVVALLLMLVGLQYKLWFGEDSLPKWFKVERKLDHQAVENQRLTVRNRALEADVAELKTGEQALEEQARYELGMIKEDETYYHFVN
ncbi:MAG: cell division protein FtsB [Gammaproteobacteria bacterium]|nr:cell division protein FtsB [Gammaproteobacteria bacterium]